MPFPDADSPIPIRHAAASDDRRALKESSPITGRQLTRLLARWADARRLDTRQAEAIRLAARAAPGDLGFDWWWRLLDPDSGSVFQTALTGPGSGDAIPSSFETPFGLAAPGLMTWSQDDVEYQPYLRLS